MVWPLSADDWDTQMLFFLKHGYRVISRAILASAGDLLRADCAAENTRAVWR